MISVALEDQGEIVPNRGITVNEKSEPRSKTGEEDKMLFNLFKLS